MEPLGGARSWFFETGNFPDRCVAFHCSAGSECQCVCVIDLKISCVEGVLEKCHHGVSQDTLT